MSNSSDAVSTQTPSVKSHAQSRVLRSLSLRSVLCTIAAVSTLLILMTVPFSEYIFESDLAPWIRADVGTPKIICVGDSLTAGYMNTAPGRMARLVLFHPYSIALTKALNGKAEAIALGFSGWRTVDLLDTADVHTRAPNVPEDAAPQPGIAAAIRKFRPMLAIIMVGTNDIFRAPSLEELDGRAIAVRAWRLHQIAHRSNVKTIAMGIPEWSAAKRTASPPFTNGHRVQARTELNSALKEFCGNNSNMATYIDFPFRYALGTGHWTSDGLHFTAAGSDLAGTQIAAKVKELLPELRDE